MKMEKEKKGKMIICGSGRYLVVVSTSGCGGRVITNVRLFYTSMWHFLHSLLADEPFGMLCILS